MPMALPRIRKLRSSVMPTRRRFKQTVPLEERLRIQASADRERAKALPPCREREELLLRARRAETATPPITGSKKAPGRPGAFLHARFPREISKTHATLAAFLFTPFRIASVLS